MMMMFSAYDTELPKTNFRRISRSAASRIVAAVLATVVTGRIIMKN